MCASIKKEWDGAFCDADPIWGTISDAEKERIGFTTAASDGTWWMTFDDMLANFDDISVSLSALLLLLFDVFKLQISNVWYDSACFVNC